MYKGEPDVEQRVGDSLKARALTLATAESCSGGLLGHRITNAAGSSAYFLGGIVSYSDDAKMKLLGVPQEILEAHGAVSEEVAGAMADGVRRRFQADVGIGVTGIAGPGGGSTEKPVGLVYIAIADEAGTSTAKNIFDGGRETIKEKTVNEALRLLLERLQ